VRLFHFFNKKKNNPKAHFMMTEFFPVLGAPLLSLFHGTSDDSNYLSSSMILLEGLIQAIEIEDVVAIQQRVSVIEAETFSFIKDFARCNKNLVEVLFGWLVTVHSGGSEVIDIEKMFSVEDLLLANKEVDEVTSHWKKGGKLAAIQTPVLNLYVGKFQDLIRSNSTFVPLAPVVTPKRERSFLKRLLTPSKTPKN
jgi:hypothetical protein